MRIPPGFPSLAHTPDPYPREVWNALLQGRPGAAQTHKVLATQWWAGATAAQEAIVRDAIWVTTQWPTVIDARPRSQRLVRCDRCATTFVLHNHSSIDGQSALLTPCCGTRGSRSTRARVAREGATLAPVAVSYALGYLDHLREAMYLKWMHPTLEIHQLAQQRIDEIAVRFDPAVFTEPILSPEESPAWWP